MKLGKKLLSLLLAALVIMSCAAALGFTTSAAYKIGDTVSFGSYPQSKVSLTATITALNNATKTWYSLGFYAGSGQWNTANQQSFAQYCDVTYAGTKYRGIKFTAYRPDETIYASSTASDPGSLYPQYANGYRINTTYWFKYEPLTWRVLDPTKGLIICKSAIDSQAFNNQIDYQNNKYYNKNNSTQYFACDYTKSSLRTWLTGTFLSTAFSSTEQGKLVATSIANKGIYTLMGNNSHTDLDFANTSDKVFLPSYDEMIDTSKGYQQYPGDKDSLRVRYGTDYAKCMGLQTYNSTGPYWWLRTAGKDTKDVCNVNFNGQSAWAVSTSACHTNFGVVPVVCCSNFKNASTPTTVTVTFNANGGTCATTSKTVTVGETYGMMPLVTRTGYDFSGWYDGNTKIESSTIVTKTSNHTLTAKWQGKQVNIKFDPCGGSVNPNNKDVRYGDKYGTLPTPTKGSDTFLGWYTAKVGGTLINASTTVSTTSAQTLYAHWQEASVIIPTIAIVNYVSSRTIDYRTTITFTAKTTNAPSKAEIHWFINGKDKATGDKYTVKEAKEDFEVQAKLILNGTTLANSAAETVKVKTGFFAKLVAFFRSIFGKLPKLTQRFLGVEIEENILP